MNITIGEKIKDLRKFNGITQNALASYLNVSSQSVSKWENGVSMPDLSLIPDIASYFGVTIDDLFGYTPKNSREMQIEMYSQAVYHLVQMSTCTRLEGLLALISYMKQNEINPLMYEGACMMCDGVDEKTVAIYLKAKGRNEYTDFDENYVDCIVTGINNIQRGANQTLVLHMALAHVPKSINKEVRDKFYEVSKANIEENRKILCTQSMKFEKTNLLEFISGLADEVIQKLLQEFYNKKAHMIIPAMIGASGEVNKRIIENIIPEDEHDFCYALGKTEQYRYFDYYINDRETSMPKYTNWINYFIYSDLHKQRYLEDYICEAQREILTIYNQIEK